MQKRTNEHELTRYETILIRVKARQLSRACGLSHQDIPDIEHDLAMELIRRLPKFDPAKARRTTFAIRIIEHHCSTLLRDRYREMRDPRRLGPSLDEPCINEDGEINARIDNVRQEDLDALYGSHTPDPFGAVVLRIDVSTVMEGLPPMLRKGADLLSRMNIKQAAKEIGMSRTSFYDKCIAPLRDAFSDLTPYVSTCRHL